MRGIKFCVEGVGWFVVVAWVAGSLGLVDFTFRVTAPHAAIAKVAGEKP